MKLLFLFLCKVDDLKAKLAVQEVELQKKNDEADKLIRIVETETAKVTGGAPKLGS